MARINREELGAILDQSLSRAEEAFLHRKPPRLPGDFAGACNDVFESRTQAYREVLLGCPLMRIHDKTKDIRLPYIKLGANAFSGRSLDENVVNPFLRANSIPSSGGPYLSVFRRSVALDQSTETGLKDKGGYRALLDLLEVIEGEKGDDALLALLDYVLYRFVLLREEAKVELIRFERMSVSQYQRLIKGLLDRPSGGLFPAVLVLAMVESIGEAFALSWQVQHQDINVADSAVGVAGDITVRRDDSPWLSIEVTERPVDATRLRGTFKDKIAPTRALDYVFMVHVDQVDKHAKEQAEKYFAQGYDVNFVDINEWLANTLVTIGRDGRAYFQGRLAHHLGAEGVDGTLKVAWNQEMETLTASS